MPTTADLPQQFDYRFDALIGVDVKGSLWPCVEIPGSAELFGTKKVVRGDVEIDGVPLTDIGLMVTGTGGHMISISQKLQKQLGKSLGDQVTVLLIRRTK